jgi:hypothetical protein
MICAWSVYTGQMKNVNKILVEKFKVRVHLEDLSARQRIVLKTDFIAIGYYDWILIHVALDRDYGRTL